MSTRVCPQCDAEYLATVSTCVDCRVALDDLGADRGPEDATTSAGGDGPATDAELDDGVGYLLDDWSDGQRADLSAALRQERVSFVWEDDELVVPERHADWVEELIDEMDHPDALDAEEDDDDGGAALLSTLYVASDVLMRDPDNPPAVTELLEAADILDDVGPPFGVDGPTWLAIHERADALAELLGSGAEPELVTEAATNLRAAVRPLV
ncbi:MAG TPA: hypothetical protein VMN58_06610 [Acidimicrobiales bacterium]|nr:hypothetical protein [Acidimicrobiales bacterium]